MSVLSAPLRINRRDALTLWQQVTLENVIDDGPDFTARQLAIFTTIYLEDGPHTVRSLARRLQVTKPVICRAVNKLEAEQFLMRTSDPKDRRSVILARTGPGSSYLHQFAEQICQRIRPQRN